MNGTWMENQQHFHLVMIFLYSGISQKLLAKQSEEVDNEKMESSQLESYPYNIQN